MWRKSHISATSPKKKKKKKRSFHQTKSGWKLCNLELAVNTFLRYLYQIQTTIVIKYWSIDYISILAKWNASNSVILCIEMREGSREMEEDDYEGLAEEEMPLIGAKSWEAEAIKHINRNATWDPRNPTSTCLSWPFLFGPTHFLYVQISVNFNYVH